jgi:hypothetical protein
MSNLMYAGRLIRVETEFLNLTDMWKAAGSDPSKRPVKWLDQDSTKTFIEFLADNVKVTGSHFELFRIVRGGREPATWAHWQVGMAYAKYLSPAFHAWANQVVRDYMSGKLVPIAPRSRFELLILESKSKWERLWDNQLRLEFMRLYRSEYEQDMWPLAGMSLIGKIYDLILGVEVMAEVRATAKAKGGNDVAKLHQYLTPKARELFTEELGKVVGMAVSSKTPRELLGKLESYYARNPRLGTCQSGTMKQLELGGKHCGNQNCGLPLPPHPSNGAWKFCPNCGRRVK